MTSEGHIIVAIASTIIIKHLKIMPTLTYINWWHLLPIVILSSLLPDIDHPKSIIGQRFKWISKPIFGICGHRGFTHSLLIVIIFFLFKYSKYYIIPYDIQQGIMIGYISHIIADIFTPAGVYLLWPLRLRIRLPIINSSNNNKRERIFCFILICYILSFSIDILNFNKNFLDINLFLNKLKNFLIN